MKNLINNYNNKKTHLTNFTTMEKRYTSDPKQALRRNAFNNKINNKKSIFLLLLALLLGGMTAFGENLTFRIDNVSGYTYDSYNRNITGLTMTLESYGTTGNQFKIASMTIEPSSVTTLYNTSGGTIGVGNTFDGIGALTVNKANVDVTIIFNNARSIILAGSVFVDRGSITMQLPENVTYHYTEANPTLKLTSRLTTHIFRVGESYNSTVLTACQLTIKGNPATGSESYPNSYNFDNNFVIHFGGPTVSINESEQNGYYWNPQITTTSAGVAHKGAAARLRQGKITLQHVTMRNFWGNFDTSSQLGLLQVFTNNKDNAVKAVYDHCYFTQNAASKGCMVLKLQSASANPNNNAERSATMTNCLVENNYCLDFRNYTSISSGVTFAVPESNSAIRSVGNDRISLSITGCKICYNYGGGVRWHAGAISTPLVLTNCNVTNNFSTENGAGILFKAPGRVVNCKIKNNRSIKDGGGIYVTTYDEFNSAKINWNEWEPNDNEVFLDPQTEIEDNKALGNGGGIAIKAIRIYNNYNNANYTYYYAAGTTDPFRMSFQLNGALVKDNHALGQDKNGTDNGLGNGGGVYISRAGDACFYGTSCDLNYGTIENNKSKRHGGGVFIAQEGASAGYSSLHPQQPITVTTGNTPDNFIIKDNEAEGVFDQQTGITTVSAHGGGIYVYTPSDVLASVDVLDNSYIQHNTALSNGGGLFLEEGDVRIKGATFGGAISNLGNTASGSGGGVYTNKGNIYINYWATVAGLGNPVWALQNESTPTIISNNTAAVNGGGVNTHEGVVFVRGQANEANRRIQITNNTATNGSGGGVFCMGLAPVSGTPPQEYIRMSNVDIIGNKALSGTGTGASGETNGCGGGVYLQYGIINMNRVKIQKNMAHVNGGGINDHNGTINLAGCEIGGATSDLGNTCGYTSDDTHVGSGGGVYTNAGDVNLTHHNEAGTLSVSLVKHNTAELNGGGLNTHVGKITVEGTSDHPIDICNNTASYGAGGGIFCMGQETGSNLQTLYIDIKHANLRNNKATSGTSSGSGVSYGCGGGMYLQYGEIDATNVTMQNNFANVNGGAINNHEGFVDIWGCQIGGAEYYDGNDATGDDRGNKANHSGGGIYTRHGDIDIEDYTEHKEGAVHLYESGINHNEAGENGGGINTHSGTITINDDEYKELIEVTYNKAKKGGAIFAYQGTIIAHNAIINNNYATDNGGAINNHTGDITLYGGELNNNTSESGKGGGAYTNLGDVRILPYPKNNNNPTVDDGTKIFNNIAKSNGGGINDHTGRVDIRHATLYNNTSTLGSGGGIYCEGPKSGSDDGLGFTIRLLNSDLFKNKTRGADGTDEAPTGRGGGIYLAYGSIFAENSNIVENSANINGGGLDNREGSILVYGCNLLRNRAVTRSGGGIYTEHGNITTGPCTVPDPDNANVTLSKATVVQQNTAKVNGGGLNNHNGNIYLNGDLIGGDTPELGNVANTGHGGGIYIKNGIIDMFGGKIAHNEAAKGDGGGVWSGGGTFNIQKRQGKPVIQIIDVEDVKKTDGADTWEAVIHYHLINKGDNSATVTHGIRYDLKTASSYTNDVTYNSSNPNHEEREAGCYRIKITGLTGDNTKYKVEAYASYPDGSTPPETIEGVSFITYFETFTTKPTVITGNATNITQNSAELSGKVIHSGTTDVTECGFYWGTTDNPTTKVVINDALDYFDYVLEGLDPNTTYYFKAFAKNSTTGTTEATGEVVSFKTTKAIPVLTSKPSVPAIDSTFASFTYDIPNQPSGNPTIARCGFVWSTDDDPDPREDFSVIASDPGTGTITYTLSGVEEEHLEPSTCYYVRAYAGYDANSHDPRDYAFSEPTQFFTTDIDATKPVVRAIRFSDITQHSAVITGKIVQSGQTGSTSGLDNIQMYGVCFSSTNEEPTHNGTDCTHVEFVRGDTGFTLNADSTFSVTITHEMLNGVSTQMAPQTTYYLRVYASSVTPSPTEAQIAYSNDFNFTTLPLVRPTAKVNVKNMEIVSTDKAQADFIGTYTDGGSTYTKYGYRYGDWSGENDTPVQLGYAEVTSPTANTYTWTLNTLTRGKQYWAEAYVITAYSTTEVVSDRVTFTTPVELPEIVMASTTPSLQSNGLVQAVVDATVVKTGDKPITKHGFVWSTLGNPAPTLGTLSDEVDNWYQINNGAPSGSTYSYTIQETATPNISQLYSNRYYCIRPVASTEASPVGNYPTTAFNDAEWYYGPGASFLTSPKLFTDGFVSPVVNSTTAKLGFRSPSLEADPSNPNIIKVGICWIQGTGDPTNTDSHYEETWNPGTATSEWTKNMDATGLTGSKTYSWRAYIINKENAVTYSDTKTFTTTAHTITAGVSPENSGHVAFTSGLTEIGGWDGSSSITLTATANTGYTFDKWQRDGSDITEATNTTLVETPANDDHTYTAVFTLNNYTVNFAVSGSGSMTVDGESVSSGTYDHFTQLELAATANSDNTFVSWTSGGNVLSTDNPFNYEVTGTATVTANFGTSRTISVSPNNAEYGSVSGGGTYGEGATCTVTATPNTGYTFVNWMENNTVVSIDASYSFTVGNGNRTLVANFAQTGGGKGNNHPRDIYPAPAREPWDWDEDFFFPMTDTITEADDDTIAALRASLNRTVVAPQDIPYIEKNVATEGRGGGIFMTNSEPENPTRLVFAGPMDGGTDYGKIIYNHAAEAGGGIYIDEKAYMQMKGRCEVNANWVPKGKYGGGIYLAGRLYVGNLMNDGLTAHALKVNRNFAMDGVSADYDTITALYNANNGLTPAQKALRNNVFLVRSEYDYDRAGSSNNDDDSNVIALLSNISGKSISSSKDDPVPTSSIGFSVMHGFCPVIATASEFPDPNVPNSGHYLNYNETVNGTTFAATYEKWLRNLMPQNATGAMMGDNGAVFEDSETYIAIHTPDDNPPFRGKYIYLWGSWPNPVVSEDPERNTGENGANMSMRGTGKHYIIKNPDLGNSGPSKILEWEIYSEEGLSWFTSYVNGLNAFATGDMIGTDSIHRKYNSNYNPYAKAKVMNDLDMTKYFWVPIGSVTSFSGMASVGNPSANIYVDNDDHPYKGEFDGQGHIIKGIDCRFLTGVKKYGLFGELASDSEGNNPKSAMVKNVFVDESQFIPDNTEQGYLIGGIAGTMSGTATLSAAEARTYIDVTRSKKSETYVGGLVGKMDGTAVVHSSMAMPEIVGTAGYMGGLVGQVGETNKLLNSFANPKFPNAKTSPYYNIMGSGRFIGGLVGDNRGVVENCYTRLQGDEPTYDGTHSVFGWFAGTNTVVANANAMGGIRFCYAPQGKTDYVKSIAYHDIVNGTFGVEVIDPNPGHEVPFGHGNYTKTDRISNKYGFKHRDQQMTPVVENNAIYITAKTNDTLIGGLQHALNHWVDTANKTTPTYAKWTRTMASPINDDYPILMLKDFNSVGSKDSIYLLYEDNINDMWNPPVTTGIVTIPGKDFQSLNVSGSPAAMYLYDVQPTVSVPSPDPGGQPTSVIDPVSISGNNNVPLYINEDIGITQPANAELTARAGVTIKNRRKGTTDYTDDPNWHLFSSALYRKSGANKVGVPIGLEYHTGDNNNGVFVNQQYINDIVHKGPQNFGHPESTWGNRELFDPPQTTWYQSDDDTKPSYNANGSQIGYFPTNTPYGRWRSWTQDPVGFFDLYEYNEVYYHWINYKREGTDAYQDHWHMDKDAGQGHLHYRIGWDKSGTDRYFNDVNMPSGKGYMMAFSGESMMMADGILNTGVVEVNVTKTSLGANLPPNGHGTYNYTGPWRALNLVGNPYQSYLDFDSLAKYNKELLYSVTNTEGKGVYCYATRYDNDYQFVFYTTTQSRNDPDLSGTRYIHPHQGFFVKVKAPGTLEFTDDMRVAGTNISLGSNFRGGGRDYPLVNLICYESSGHRDFTTVEVNRPSLGGGSKMQNLRTGSASIYARLENEDYQTLFAPVGINTVPVWFETNSDDVFTLRWSTLHGDFSYLHLIDNLMGADIDCLTTEEYRFEASVEDYKSRFKLVFRCDNDEPDEPEEPDDGEDTNHFAFMFGDELIVNGEGMFQMFDVQGRCLLTTRVVGGQSSISLPEVACGVYLLRLIGNDKVKIQKMVIK